MLYLDFDGVLCDFVAGFLQYSWRKLRLPFSHVDVTDYNLPKALAKGDTEREAVIDKCFQKYLLDKEALLRCPPVWPIWSALHQRKDHLLGHVAICTARTDLARAAAAYWLNDWGLGWIPFVEPVDGYKKLDLLRPRDILVEDNAAVARVFMADARSEARRFNGSMILVAWPWSSSFTDGVDMRESGCGTIYAAEVHLAPPELVAHWLKFVLDTANAPQ